MRDLVLCLSSGSAVKMSRPIPSRSDRLKQNRGQAAYTKCASVWQGSRPGPNKKVLEVTEYSGLSATNAADLGIVSMKYRAQRYPARQPVHLGVDGKSVQGMMTSVSSTGAGLIVKDAVVAPGAKLKFSYAGQLGAGLPATVRWATTDRIGISFDRPLGRAELDRLRSGVRQGARPVSTRTGYAKAHSRF